jgi:hypothetical protein
MFSDGLPIACKAIEWLTSVTNRAEVFRTLPLLTQPNVATLHAVGEANGLRFIAMEFVEGELPLSKLFGISRPGLPRSV